MDGGGVDARGGLFGRQGCGTWGRVSVWGVCSGDAGKCGLCDLGDVRDAALVFV